MSLTNRVELKRDGELNSLEFHFNLDGGRYSDFFIWFGYGLRLRIEGGVLASHEG